ncbi:hypothetical protein [Streptomyces sp. NPDC002324]
MSTRGGTLHVPAEARAEQPRQPAPAVVGTAIAALTLIPTTVLALHRHRRAAAAGSTHVASAPAGRAEHA